MKRKRKVRVLKSDKTGCCVFCGTDDDDEARLGEMMKKYGIVVHYFCMLFSSGLNQRGRDHEGISGFLLSDIQKELRRGQKLNCSYCKSSGATIGCSVKGCFKRFHMTCGRNHESLHQFFGQFSSYCNKHKPRQDSKLVIETVDNLCNICYGPIDIEPSDDILYSTCCKNAKFHFECVQRHASSAGGYFCRCPMCNNLETFQLEMMTYGIYIPERDASWELEENAFRELYERHNQCDHPKCICPEGRRHEDERHWSIILCNYCGSQGCHSSCGKISVYKPSWICKDCQEIVAKKIIKRPSSSKSSATVVHNLADTSSDVSKLKLIPCKVVLEPLPKNIDCIIKDVSKFMASTSLDKRSLNSETVKIKHCDTDEEIDIIGTDSESDNGISQKVDVILAKLDEDISLTPNDECKAEDTDDEVTVLKIVNPSSKLNKRNRVRVRKLSSISNNLCRVQKCVVGYDKLEVKPYNNNRENVDSDSDSDIILETVTKCIDKVCENDANNVILLTDSEDFVDDNAKAVNNLVENENLVKVKPGNKSRRRKKLKDRKLRNTENKRPRSKTKETRPGSGIRRKLSYFLEDDLNCSADEGLETKLSSDVVSKQNSSTERVSINGKEIVCSPVEILKTNTSDNNMDAMDKMADMNNCRALHKKRKRSKELVDNATEVKPKMKRRRCITPEIVESDSSSSGSPVKTTETVSEEPSRVLKEEKNVTDATLKKLRKLLRRKLKSKKIKEPKKSRAEKSNSVSVPSVSDDANVLPCLKLKKKKRTDKSEIKVKASTSTMKLEDNVTADGNKSCQSVSMLELFGYATSCEIGELNKSKKSRKRKKNVEKLLITKKSISKRQKSSKATYSCTIKNVTMITTTLSVTSNSDKVRSQQSCLEFKDQRLSCSLTNASPESNRRRHKSPSKKLKALSGKYLTLDHYFKQLTKPGEKAESSAAVKSGSVSVMVKSKLKEGDDKTRKYSLLKNMLKANQACAACHVCESLKVEFHDLQIDLQD